MHILIPKTYDRADVLMSAGISTFVSAALSLVIPRFGIAILESLLGLFLIGCAFAARARLRGTARSKANASGRPWFDRYDAAMVLAVIIVQICIAGSLRHFGWSEGTVRMFPLILLGTAILLKPRLIAVTERRARQKEHTRQGAVAHDVAVPMAASNACCHAENVSCELDEKGAR
jgi:hypothetical protein